MSKKGVQMTLQQFYQYTEGKERSERQHTRRMPAGTRPRAGRVKGSRSMPRSAHARPFPGGMNAAKVAGSKPSMRNVEINDQTFPSLHGSAEPSFTEICGAWSNGVQTIIDAKDLPDPRIQAALDYKARMEAERERAKQTQQQRNDNGYDYDYNSGSDMEPEQEQAPPVCDPLDPIGMMEEEWDEL